MHEQFNKRELTILGNSLLWWQDMETLVSFGEEVKDLLIKITDAIDKFEEEKE